MVSPSGAVFGDTNCPRIVSCPGGSSFCMVRYCATLMLSTESHASITRANFRAALLMMKC